MIAAQPLRPLWTISTATEAPSFQRELAVVALDPACTMIATSRAVILEHREALAVLASSALFLTGLMALLAVTT